ncbi:hypothetical protein C8R44DRAFT_411551 [Mycena epipterygia]|nr:hypothetical protein C8R44DRAFT_411551 [Mycena epipterygia]
MLRMVQSLLAMVGVPLRPHPLFLPAPDARSARAAAVIISQCAGRRRLLLPRLAPRPSRRATQAIYRRSRSFHIRGDAFDTHTWDLYSA